jgi:homoserine dehydrogenase
MKIAILGYGKVGRELTRQTYSCPYCTYISFADSGGIVAKPSGFSRNEIEEISQIKINGKSVKEYEKPNVFHFESIEETFDGKNKPDVLVDTSITQSYDTIIRAIESGINIAGSNKAPYSDVMYRKYLKMKRKADENGVIVDNRTTVSANLGANTRSEEFLRTAGGVTKIRGSLSGTMNFIPWFMETEGVLFSVALNEAVLREYTETDPRYDIVCKDARRKGVILGRKSGNSIEMSDISIEKVIPDELMNIPVSDFMSKVHMMDEDFSRKMSEAKSRGKVLRNVAELDFANKEYLIGFKALSPDDRVAMAKKTNNVISIYPVSWRGKCITIEGPGAGNDVTAQGLFAGLDYIKELKF